MSIHFLDVLRLVALIHEYQDEYINVFFTVDKYEGIPKIMEPNKCDNLQWFNIDELPENTIMRVRNVLINMQKGIIYDDGNFSHQKAKS